MHPRLPSVIQIGRWRLGGLRADNWVSSCFLRTNLGAGSRLRYSSAAEVDLEKPYFVTTPIFYVNSAPHVGHLYTMVLADILKRWQILQGRKAILCTGTDEHGLKIQLAAARTETPPNVFCDNGAETFKNLANQANISFDHFIRTTDPKHHDAVQHIWYLLNERGLIYEGKHEGWYSVSDETFYPSSAVKQTQDPITGQKVTVSVETEKEVEWTSESNYHFKLSAMVDKLLSFYKKNPHFVVPVTRYKSVIDTVSSGLSDLSISRPRSRLTWGIPVPSDDEQTVYVWVDALINYITASGYPWVPGKEHIGGWPADVHVIGKDIVRFHCIHWPALLLALDLPPPKQILTHAHWTMNQTKMSKSIGNVVNPFYAMQRYGIDAVRFYLAHDGGIADDGGYSNERVVERYIYKLQNGLGNLLNRVCSKAFDMEAAIKIGLDGANMTELDKHQKEVVETASEKVANKMAKLDIPGALKEIMRVISQTNKYLQHTAPWVLGTNQIEERHKIIYLSSEAIRVSGILLQPFMPTKVQALLEQISVTTDKREFMFAKFGEDRTYGVGSSGRRMMLFPPLSE